jgi:hypothetical protein
MRTAVVKTTRRSFRAGGLFGLLWALGACADSAGPAKVQPELSAITPDAVFGGQLRSVTLSGRGFGQGVYQLRAGNAGVSITNVLVVSESVLVGDLFVETAATIGSTAIHLVVDGGEFNQVPFHVVQAPNTTIDSIRPQVALRGDTVIATIHGTGFVADSTAVSILGEGLQVQQSTVVSDTRIDVVLVVAATAVPGTRQVRATTYGRVSGPLPININLRPTASLLWISGGGLTDSIGAFLDTVIVEVRDDRGAPQPGVAVSFNGLRPWGGSVPILPFVTLGAPPSYTAATHLTRTTGTDGRAAVTVRAAHLPGLARVAYSIGAIARTDSVMYTIQPGSPASIRLTPRVGAIRVNDTLRFAAELLDRVQNVVPDTSWAISVDGVVATLEDGTLVRGATLGNALVRATWGTRRDSAELATSVVVTHDMHTARKVADRVLMLFPLARLAADEPQVIFDGPPSQLEKSRDPVRARSGRRAVDGNA